MSSDTVNSDAISPFRVDISDADLTDLWERLARTRWPDQLQGQEWVYGTELKELQALVEYWRTGYDWRAAEAELNQYPQFVTEIDGENVHFLHVRSERDDAVPLLLTHGWPGSVVEFLDLIAPLTSPPDGGPAFHLVIPSLPGFGFSGPTVTTGVSPKRIGAMWAQLMSRLGYDSYLAQGGDWGAIITGWVGMLDPDHCQGIHLNMVVAPPNEELLADATPEEQAALAQMGQFQAEGVGYQAIQGTRPQTLAYAHSDSPAGLLGWILEKFRAWSDCEGDVFAAHDRDRLLTNVMLYWLTNTAGSSARIYYEFRHGGSEVALGSSVPMGGAVFPKELYLASRRWAEASYNVAHWSEFDQGGHFAALEQPALLAADIAAFATAVGAK